MVGATKTWTKADKDRADAISDIGCLACAIDGYPGTPCEIDHLLESTSRYEDEHRFTIGLDAWHHRGVPPSHCCGSLEEATACHGPSRRHNSKAFSERYGSDDQLLAIQDGLIRLRQQSARRGEYLTPRQYGKLARALHTEVVRGRTPTDVGKAGQ